MRKISALPWRVESKSSQRPSPETFIASTTWLPVVTCRATDASTATPEGMGSDHTFARARYVTYARCSPLADNARASAPSPVVTRCGSPSTRPAAEIRTT
jgi:hypothetical protein